jgi:competence protein ComFC
MWLIDVIYPRVCVGCSQEGAYICSDCQRLLRQPDPICPICCRPSLGGWAHARCKTNHGLDRLLVGLSYRGLVQNALKKVKYKNSWDVVDQLTDICQFETGQDTVFTAVPLHARKARERGFNQAERISRRIAGTDSRYIETLLRRRVTQPMFGLTKKERTLNIAGAFSPVIDPLLLDLVILVDDVWTTGSTIRECAAVLKTAGVKAVWGVCLAR